MTTKEETTDKTDELTNDLILTVAEAYPQYDKYNFVVHNLLSFRGKSIEEWQLELNIPTVSEVTSLDYLERASRIMIEKIDLVMTNLGFARSAYDSAKMHYESSLSKKNK